MREAQLPKEVPPCNGQGSCYRHRANTRVTRGHGETHACTLARPVPGVCSKVESSTNALRCRYQAASRSGIFLFKGLRGL